MKKNIMFFCFTLIVILVVISQNNFVYASSTQSYLITEEELYDETNTYDYISAYNPNEARYDFSAKNGNQVVSTDEPLMTVFTHGLGGNASHWSNINTGVFAYSDDSLITRLAKTTDSNIYLIDFNSATTFKIYNITNELYGGIDGTFSGIYTKNSSNDVTHITDISKHSIFVFEATSTVANGNNDGVYSQFNYAISQIVYDMKIINDDVLPKMNLIGHSRGGITNMQYALDHPDLIYSIYSLGTPYTGSTSASLDAIWFNGLFANLDAELDIISETTYNKYMNRWNEGYLPENPNEDLYSHINVMALAGYGTLLNLAKGLTTQDSLAFLSNQTGLSEDVLDYGINSIFVVLNGAILGQYFTPAGITKVALGKLIAGVVSEFGTNLDLSQSAIDDLIQILTNEINLDYHFPFVSWYNDGLVDLGSQLGYEGLIPIDGQQYKGFERVTKAFTDRNTNFDNTNMKMPAVVHNLEASDKELGTYILADITTGNANNLDYETYDVSDEEIGISTYIGATTSNTLNIPSYINGKKVVAIGDYAFANNLYGHINITSIKIPSTIKEIGTNAFYNSESISSITFSDNSELVSIGENSFSNIPNLTDFCIVDNLEYIGESAFSNSGITNFNINANTNYLWENNFLIDTNVTNQNSYIAVYANPETFDFVVPTSVKILSSSLFENNRNIVSIDLNNVEFIGNNAFMNSTLYDIYGGNYVNNIGKNAFKYSEWQGNQSDDYIKLGTVLVDYVGEETNVVIPSGITRISDSMFTNGGIESITLPSTLETVGKNAFTNCDNLSWVLFTSTQPPVLDGKIAEDNVTLYVKGSALSYYENSVYYENINNIITTKTFNITFMDINNQYLGNKVEIYGTSFDQFVTAPSIVGKDFIHWINQDGIIIKQFSYLYEYEDCQLKPVYEDSIYTLNIYNGNNQEIIELTYGDTLILDIPTKEGYIFKGWYDSQSNGNKIIDENGVIVWQRTNEIEYLFAQYSLIEYSVILKTVGGELTENFVYSFNAENPLTADQIEEVKKFGYVFQYWKINGVEFETTYGLYSNIILTAYWKGKVVSISSGAITINDEISIINMAALSTSNVYVITIGENVKSATFIGGNKIFNNMRIIVSNRSGALILGFDSINFYPKKSTTGNGDNAITSSSNYELYVTYKNSNSITGGEGKNGTSYYSSYSQATNNESGSTGLTGGQAGNGGYGIKAFKVTLTEYDSSSSIIIKGGTGGTGGRGGNGQDGSDGVQSPNGSFINPQKGDNGATGGIGGTGGRGGTGGYAIYVSSSTYLKVSSTGHYTLIGGAGGQGGTGGYGGTGGEGASDTSSNIWNGVGEPGEGGNGGRGGNGGNGGTGRVATNALYVYGTGGEGGAGGLGNRGGYGGIGGSAGNYGDDGSDGDDGSMGAAGTNGIVGASGYNSQGTSASIKDTGYVYNKKFLALMV